MKELEEKFLFGFLVRFKNGRTVRFAVYLGWCSNSTPKFVFLLALWTKVNLMNARILQNPNKQPSYTFFNRNWWEKVSLNLNAFDTSICDLHRVLCGVFQRLSGQQTTGKKSISKLYVYSWSTNSLFAGKCNWKQYFHFFIRNFFSQNLLSEKKTISPLHCNDYEFSGCLICSTGLI